MHTHTHAHTHAARRYATPETAADMKLTEAGVWTWAVVLVLLVDSCPAQKVNVHWGPQSMMYLKGKHGRRFVTEDDAGVLKQGLLGWYALLQGIQKQPRHTVASDRVLIGSLQKR